MRCCGDVVCFVCCMLGYVGGCGEVLRPKKWGPETVKNGPRVWAFCKIEFPGIQKPVQILTQKSPFFRNPGNRGVGVIWSVRWGVLIILLCWWCCLFVVGCYSVCVYCGFWVLVVVLRFLILIGG